MIMRIMRIMRTVAMMVEFRRIATTHLKVATVRVQQ
jgi:hypothetical protein